VIFPRWPKTVNYATGVATVTSSEHWRKPPKCRLPLLITEQQLLTLEMSHREYCSVAARPSRTTFERLARRLLPHAVTSLQGPGGTTCRMLPGPEFSFQKARETEKWRSPTHPPPRSGNLASGRGNSATYRRRVLMAWAQAGTCLSRDHRVVE